MVNRGANNENVPLEPSEPEEIQWLRLSRAEVILTLSSFRQYRSEI